MKRLLIILAILGMTLLVYLPILRNGFVWDDTDFIVRWQTTKSVLGIPRLLLGDLPEAQKGVYRPVRAIAYLITWNAFGDNPLPYHILGIAIHVLATFLVFQIAELLFRKPVVSFIAALLFGIHPVHIEAIAYSTSSFDTIGIVFLLGSLFFYLKSRNTDTSTKTVSTSSLILAFVAYFTYEITLVLPAILFCIEVLLPNGKIRWITLAKRLLPYTAGALLFLALRTLIIGILPRGIILVNGWYTFLTQTKAWWVAFRSLVFPITQSPIPHLFNDITTLDIRPDAIRTQHLSDPTTILGITVVVVFGLSIVYFWQKEKRIALALVWIILGFLPTAFQMLTGVLFAERYLYFSSIGFVFLMGILVDRLLPKPAYRQIIIAGMVALLTLYGALTVRYNLVWKSNRTLLSHAISLSPRSASSWLNYGVGLAEEGKLEEAKAAFATSLSIFPNYAESYISLGAVYEKQGNTEKAIEAYGAAVEKNPYITQHVIDFAAFLAARGKLPEAEAILLKGIKARPNTYQLYENLAIVDDALGKEEEAQKALLMVKKLKGQSSLFN